MRYTVIDKSGNVLDTGLSAEMAAHTVLTDDGCSYDVRKDDDVWELWSRQEVANRPWSKTICFSLEDTEQAAWADIARQVIARDAFAAGARGPEVMTDEAYAEMLRLSKDED